MLFRTFFKSYIVLQFHSYNFKFTRNLVLYGHCEVIRTDKICDFIILMAKFYIYRCKVQSINLNININRTINRAAKVSKTIFSDFDIILHMATFKKSRRSKIQIILQLTKSSVQPEVDGPFLLKPEQRDTKSLFCLMQLLFCHIIDRSLCSFYLFFGQIIAQ